jgi:hypothetical protein
LFSECPRKQISAYFLSNAGFDLSNSWANDIRAEPADMKFLAFFIGNEFAMGSLQVEFATGILEARPHTTVALRAAIRLQNTRDGGVNGDGGKAEQ